MNAREVIRLLTNDGWQIKNQVGSHKQFIHPLKKGKVTISQKSKEEIPPKTLTSILRQAGLK